MTIERRTYERTYPAAIVTTACSFCGEQIPEQESLADHLRNDCPENGGNR
jgi:hypothetical protein